MGETTTVHFATCNGRVTDRGVGSENYDRRKVQAYVNRSNFAARRYGMDSTYAVVSYKVAAR